MVGLNISRRAERGMGEAQEGGGGGARIAYTLPAVGATLWHWSIFDVK